MFSDVILVSNYHGCKEEVINLIPHYLIDIIYKIVAKAIPFRKIAFVPNRNKLMLQIIFILSDWIFMEQIIASSTPSVLAGERDFQKILPEALRGELGY